RILFDVGDHGIKLSAVTDPVVERLILPEGATRPIKEKFRPSRGRSLQPPHRDANRYFRQNQQMRMIRRFQSKARSAARKAWPHSWKGWRAKPPAPPGSASRQKVRFSIKHSHQSVGWLLLNFLATLK